MKTPKRFLNATFFHLITGGLVFFSLLISTNQQLNAQCKLDFSNSKWGNEVYYDDFNYNTSSFPISAEQFLDDKFELDDNRDGDGAFYHWDKVQITPDGNLLLSSEFAPGDPRLIGSGLNGMPDKKYLSGGLKSKYMFNDLDQNGMNDDATSCTFDPNSLPVDKWKRGFFYGRFDITIVR